MTIGKSKLSKCQTFSHFPLTDKKKPPLYVWSLLTNAFLHRNDFYVSSHHCYLCNTIHPSLCVATDAGSANSHKMVISLHRRLLSDT